MSLASVYRKIAERTKENVAKRLRAKRGVNGQFLPGKKVDDGKPLGIKTTSQGLFGVIRKGAVRLAEAGFDITWPDVLDDFHFGQQKGKPPRPIVGMSRKEQEQAAREVLEELKRQARKLGLAK